VDAVNRAKSLCDRGRELHNARRLEEAVEVYKEALAIYRQLAEQHPHEYLPEVAWTLRALADTLYSLRRLDEAINAYGEALTIHQQLTPEVFDFGIAQSLWRLGKTLHRLQQSEEALKALEKASATLRRLARRRSPEYET